MKALPALMTSLCLVGSIWAQEPTQGKTQALTQALTHEFVTEPFIGVERIERYTDSPRRIYVNIVTIDPKAQGIRFTVTPYEQGLPNGDETTTQTAGAFVEQVGAQLGFNGSFFRLEHHSQQRPTNNTSIVASEGHVYSPWQDQMPNALAIDEDGTPRIVTPADGDQFYNAVAGNVVLVEDGNIPEIERAAGTGKMHDKHPRTAVGVTRDGKLIVCTVDGRQPAFSEGVFLDELAQIMLDAGAMDALNLDGGGSTTLVADYPDDDRGARLLNSATGRGIVGSQRNNGVNLAVFAEPNPDFQSSRDLPVGENTVILQDFEDGEGTFDDNLTSGSNVGVDGEFSRADQILHNAAIGVGAQRIALTSSGEGRYTAVRLLSGGGEPANNTAFKPSGYIGFYARNVGPNDVQATLLIDDGDELERGVLRLVPADGEWHLMSWSFGDTDDWTIFQGGDGVIRAEQVTIDALYLRTETGQDVVLEWDALMHNPSGRLVP